MDKIFTKKSKIKERILYFIENQCIKKTDFCKKIGVAESNFKGSGLNSELGGDIIGKILTEYNELSPEWLLTGKDPMLKEQSEVLQQNTIADNNTIIYKELLEKKEIEIKELCREVGALSNQNTNLDKNLAALRLELECCKKENLELRGIINSQPNSSEDMPELPDIPTQLVAARAEFRQDNKN